MKSPAPGADARELETPRESSEDCANDGVTVAKLPLGLRGAFVALTVSCMLAADDWIVNENTSLCAPAIAPRARPPTPNTSAIRARIRTMILMLLLRGMTRPTHLRQPRPARP